MKTGRETKNLKSNILRLLAAVLLAAPLVASAIKTTWEIQGHITASQGADLASFQPGDPFRTLVNFDTAAVPSAILSQPPGTRYNYPASSLSFDIFIGSLGPFHVTAGARPEDTGSIILRDNVPFSLAGAPPVPVDGYTFGLSSFDPNDGGFFTNVQLIMRGPVLDIVNGAGLAETPDTRLASLSDEVFQVCRSSALNPGSCDMGELDGQIDSVSAPTYGTGYLFTARDCRVPTTDPADAAPYDCINTNRARYQQWTYPAQAVQGGGAGMGAFSYQFSPTDTDIDPMWNSGPLHASLGLPVAALGDLFGSVSFGGPVALPIVKGSTTPSDVSRINANLYGYQKYNYSGSGTPLPLIIELTYSIGDYNANTSGPEIGTRPGGASIGVVLSVIDGSVTMNQMRDAGLAGFNSLTCGSEPFGWPAGSILGTATFDNPGHQVGSQATILALQSCASPGQPIQLTAGQDFIVATSMQTPARGKAPQPPSLTGAPTNGYVDAANTLRVTFDPAAPPTLIQALADSVVPACVNCDFKPDVLNVPIDVKPGDKGKKSCISIQGKGNIPVAVLGSASFNVRNLRIDDSLRFDTLAPRLWKKGQPHCSYSKVDKKHPYEDLVCEFQNSPGTWETGQTVGILTGKLINGVPIQGSEAICLSK